MSIAEALGESMEAFKIANKVYPRRIIVYREGVSESQLDLLLTTEVSQLKNLLDKKYKDSELIFITVNSKVNARFYGKNRGDVQNPDRGLLID